MGDTCGESPEMGPADHGVVAMASVKTGVGRARARTSDAMGASRGESPWMGVSSRAEAQGFYPHLCDHWVVAKRSVAWATDRRKGMTTAARAWRW